MSFAVVPGAKLLATTMYCPFPAMPLMVNFPRAPLLLPWGPRLDGARELLLLMGGLVGPVALRGAVLLERGVARCGRC